MAKGTAGKKSLDSHELQQLKDNIVLASQTMSILAKPEDVVVFLGNTKSGKSSLTNYILGNELIGKRESEFVPITLEKSNPNESGPRIGNSIASETIYPERYSNEKSILNDLIIWDVPGFVDNRGSEMDITNAFYIHELLTKVKSAKIVLTCDINDILGHKIDNFLLLLKNCETLLGNTIIDCANSIAIVFTMVPAFYNGCPIDVNFIKKIINFKLSGQHSVNITNSVKSLIRHFTQTTDNCIGIFPQGNSDGTVYTIDNNDLADVILTRQSIPSETLQKVSPTISDNSTVKLFDTLEVLCTMNDFQNSFKVVTDAHNRQFEEWQTIMNREDIKEVDFIKLGAEMTAMREKIQYLLQYSEESVSAQLDALHRNNYKVQQDLLMNVKFIEFIDRILTTKRCDQFKNVYRKGLEYLEILLTKEEVTLRERNGIYTAKKADAIRAEQEIKLKEVIEEYETVKKELENHNEELRKGFFTAIGRGADYVVTKFTEALEMYAEYKRLAHDGVFDWLYK